VESAAFRPVDIAWLAAFRFLYGAALCVSMLRFIAYSWIDEFFVKPTFHFKYWSFEWVEPLSAAGMHGLFWVLGGLALAVAVGFCFRVTATLFFVGFAYLQLIDVATYLNHYYLAALLGGLLALSPAHRAYSLDALLWRRNTQHVSALWLYVFRFQVAVVYVFAGIAKGHTDWLVYGQPLRIWLASHEDFPLLGHLFQNGAVALGMSWAGFLFDSTIVLWLAIRKTRPFAYATVIVFHALTRALFPIGMFPVIMSVSALVFFSPSFPRVLLRRLSGFEGRLPEEAASRISTAIPVWLRRGAVIAAVAYCLLQVVVPLRFVVYGGNVRWHEQGMRFSWRVMVREKNGSITFIVRSKDTGRVWHVNPGRYLTRVQAREMAGQPDLILQVAHHIRQDFVRTGRGDVEVRVDALVSLNGRRLSRMIDPAVDLTRIEDGIGRASWILPAPNEPPPRSGPS
jgi:hypothetical protein